MFTLAILAIHRDSRIKERKHIKYYQIHKSAESHRADIENAYEYWTEETGIQFVEGYKPFRTVVISGSRKSYSSKIEIVGIYLYHKEIIIFDQSNFYDIVLHEIGHSIGIRHNDNIFDIMYPTTRSFNMITPTSILDLEKAMNKRYYLLFY